MKYKLYQIGEEHENFEFRGHTFCNEHGFEVKEENYKLVYTEDDHNICSNLDEIYTRHNRDDRPDGHICRSLSVSDVVLINTKDNEWKAFFVDSIGFVPVEEFLSYPLDVCLSKISDDCTEYAIEVVGKNIIYAIQECEDGYDYTIYHNGLLHDGGVYDDSEIALKEALREIIIDDFKDISGETVRTVSYDDTVGNDTINTNEVEAYRKFVDDLMEFYKDVDSYEFLDQTESSEDAEYQINNDVFHGGNGIRKFLTEQLDSADNAEKAKELLHWLDIVLGMDLFLSFK